MFSFHAMPSISLCDRHREKRINVMQAELIFHTAKRQPTHWQTCYFSQIEMFYLTLKWAS